ncbi:MAG TPA: efflux RND transporter periplasmic adaptor subunit [Gemmataceae bacterium]|nr:efflux RND transporter periplasmic adaptor subunit [Gemmataceae bacterium]
MNDNGESNLGYQEPGRTGGAATLSDRVKSLRLGNPNANLRTRSSKLPWVLAIFFFLVSAFLLLKTFGKPPDDASKSAAPAAMEKADSKDVALESKGYIVPAHQIQIIPKISGMVTELNFQEGDKVKEGYPLANLEEIEYEADYRHAVAAEAAGKQRFEELKCSRPQEIKQAKGELDEARANLNQLKLDWERSSRLRNETLSQKERELAQYSFEAQKGRVEKLQQAYDLMVEGPRKEKRDAAEADYQQAQADLKKAKWRLDNCKIVSPISGTILSKKTEKGSVVFPNSFNTAAYICDMANLRDLEVDLAIQERDIGQVYRLQKCRILSEAYPTREPYEGYVDRLMPIADRAKGAVTVRVKVKPKKGEDPGSILKPDMGVIVSFLKEKIGEEDLAQIQKAINDQDDVASPSLEKAKENPTKSPAEPKKDEKEENKN